LYVVWNDWDRYPEVITLFWRSLVASLCRDDSSHRSPDEVKRNPGKVEMLKKISGFCVAHPEYR
jgi:hypothetical protein